MTGHLLPGYINDVEEKWNFSKENKDGSAVGDSTLHLLASPMWRSSVKNRNEETQNDSIRSVCLAARWQMAKAEWLMPFLSLLAWLVLPSVLHSLRKLQQACVMICHWGLLRSSYIFMTFSLADWFGALSNSWLCGFSFSCLFFFFNINMNEFCILYLSGFLRMPDIFWWRH